MNIQSSIPVRQKASRRRFRSPVEVLVVDDSLTVRTALSRTIDGQEDMRVAGLANSAEQAIALLREKRVDVILLDLEMPGMGGLEALPIIMELGRGAPVLIVSSQTTRGAEVTLKALALGAVDTMCKPASGEFDKAYRAELADRIRAIAGKTAKKSSGESGSGDAGLANRHSTPPRALAIAGSTGGIHALTLLLSKLPVRMGVPILVTQHLPGSFMEAFARQLEAAAGRPAVIAAPGMQIEADTIYVAPSTGHLMVERDAARIFTEIDTGPSHSGCRPSADPMLRSVGEVYGKGAIGVVLSGMGTDGSFGARTLAARGGLVFAQDMESSAVWGMPRSVVEAGIVDAVLPPAEIAGAIARRQPQWSN